MLQNEKNIALQSLRILYTFVLRAENCTVFLEKIRVYSKRVCEMGFNVGEISWNSFRAYRCNRTENMKRKENRIKSGSCNAVNNYEQNLKII